MIPDTKIKLKAHLLTLVTHVAELLCVVQDDDPGTIQTVSVHITTTKGAGKRMFAFPHIKRTNESAAEFAERCAEEYRKQAKEWTEDVKTMEENE